MEEYFLGDQLINKIMNINLTWLVEWLTGKKTYFVALGFALVGFAQGMGWITQELADLIYKFLTGAGLATMAAKVNRVAFNNTNTNVVGG